MQQHGFLLITRWKSKCKTKSDLLFSVKTFYPLIMHTKLRSSISNCLEVYKEKTTERFPIINIDCMIKWHFPSHEQRKVYETSKIISKQRGWMFAINRPIIQSYNYSWNNMNKTRKRSDDDFQRQRAANIKPTMQKAFLICTCVSSDVTQR